MYFGSCICVLQVQKEKLHAELKQVLSKKRSQFRESTCQLATPEMDTEPTEEQRVSRNLRNPDVSLMLKYFILFMSVMGYQFKI